MGEDFLGEGLRLGGGQVQLFPAGAKVVQEGGDAGVDLVLKHALGDEVLPVDGDGPAGVLLRKAETVHEGVDEGRADEGEELLPGGGQAEGRQGVLHRAGDALGGVGEGAVQVEKEMGGGGKVHGVASILYGGSAGRWELPAFPHFSTNFREFPGGGGVFQDRILG